MANKNNDTDYEISVSVNTKQAEQELDDFRNKAKHTEVQMELKLNGDSAEKELTTIKDIYTYTEKIGDGFERIVKVEEYYANAANKTVEELKEEEKIVKKTFGDIKLSNEEINKALSLLKQQTDYTMKAARATGEERVAYENAAKAAEKELEVLKKKSRENTTVGKFLEQNLSYQKALLRLEEAKSNKSLMVEVEKQKTELLKKQLAYTQQIATIQNGYKQYKANSDLALQSYRTAFQNAGESWLNSSTFLGKAFNTFQYGAIGKVQTEVYQLMSDGGQAILQFENGIVDLRRTLEDVTENELTNFGETALRYAKEYGQELANVQDAMTELARAGIDKDQLESMTQTVMIGLNTTEIETADEMVGYLVSAIKQLNMNMEDSMVIIDSWNMLADRYAVHTDDFAKAIAKAGAASKNMGLDLYDVNAMVTILGEATQASGEQIGNALRSLEVRLLRPDTIKTLEQYGITVKKDADTFLSFQEILNNVAEVIRDLPEDSVVLSDIMDAMGGSWRKNWITTLTNDWDRFNALVEEQANNIGYSARENEIAMDTLEKKMISLKQAWLELFVTMGNESGIVDIIKGLVDGTTSLLELATNNELGQFITSIVPAAAALASVVKIVQAFGDAKGGNNISKFIGWSSSLGGSIQSNQQIAENYLENLRQQNVALEQRLAISEVLDKKFKTHTSIILENERAEEDYKAQLDAVNKELEYRKQKIAELDKTNKAQSGLSSKEKIQYEEHIRAVENLKIKQDSLKETQKQATEQAKKNAAANKQLSASLVTLRTRMIATRVAAFAFGTILSMIGAAILSVIVTKAFDFFDGLHTSLEEQKEITEELNNDISELKSKIEELNDIKINVTDENQLSALNKEIDGYETLLELKKESYRISLEEEMKKAGWGKTDMQNKPNVSPNAMDNATLLSKETQLLKNYEKQWQKVVDLKEKASENEKKYSEELSTAEKKLNEYGSTIIETAAYFQKLSDAGIELTEEQKNLMKAVSDVSIQQKSATGDLEAVKNAWYLLGDGLVEIEGKYYALSKAAKDAALSTQLIKITELKDQLQNKQLEIDQATEKMKTGFAFKAAYDKLKLVDEQKKIKEELNAAQRTYDELNDIIVYSNVSNNNNSNGSANLGSSNSGGSSSSPITKKDDFQALIDNITARSEKQKELNNLYQQNIDLMEVMYNQQGKLSYENDLLEGQISLVGYLRDENEKLEEVKISLAKKYGYSIEQINSWFDENGNLTLKYYDDLNAYVGKTDDASKETQEALSDLADKVKSIHSEIKNNLTEIQNLEYDWMKKASSLAREYIELQQESDLKQLQDEYEKRLKKITLAVYGTEDADEYNNAIEKQIEVLQKKVDLLKDIEDQKDEELEKQEKLLAIEEARLKLANAEKNKNVAVLRKQADGTYQNEYIADPDTVKDAQDELQRAELEYTEFIDQLKIKRLEEQIDILKKEQEEKQKSYDEQLKDLEKWRSDQESYYEEYYSDLDKLTYEFLEDMKTAFGDDFGKIISEIQSMINSIKVPASVPVSNGGGTKVTVSGGSSSSGSTSSGGGSSSKGIYEGMTDEQKANEGRYLQGILADPNSTQGNKAWAENQLRDLYGFAQGGVASYTGLAKLHGTPNNPEVIFNANDAKKLYEMIHYNMIPIPRFNNNWQFGETNKNSGNSNITIEKIEFPNATDRNEIREALLSLPRVVLQYQ